MAKQGGGPPWPWGGALREGRALVLVPGRTEGRGEAAVPGAASGPGVHGFWLWGIGQKQVPDFMGIQEQRDSSTWEDDHQRRFSCCV